MCLEDRQVPSGGIAGPSFGSLNPLTINLSPSIYISNIPTVNGTNNDDYIVIDNGATQGSVFFFPRVTVRDLHTMALISQNTYYNVASLNINGLGGNDKIINMTSLSCKIDGGSGNDSIQGGTGHDTLIGGDGDDTLIAGNGGETLYGGAGNDYMVGGAGNDYMDGGPGNDMIYGEGGNDTLVGGDGADLLEGGPVDDMIYAGNVWAANTTVPPPSNDSNSLSYGLTGDELYGDDGNDQLFAGSGPTFMDGGDGNDTLRGGPANDTLIGGNGADELHGGADNDTLYGGFAWGPNDLAPPPSNDVTATAAGDVLYGDDGNDMLYGGNGSNTMDGGAGDDKITGGPGNDTLYGGDGNDTLIGGDGADELHGGAGNDTLYGGFVWAAGATAPPANGSQQENDPLAPDRKSVV